VLFPKDGDENLAGFPEEKEYLLNEIQKRKIKGVIFLSGDRHHTELTKLERAGSYPLYDFTCSPLTSGTHNARDEGNTLQVPGTLVNDKNYGLIEISGPRKNRQMTIKVFDLNNTLRWTQIIKEEELR
jgi:alkaline phosphatase D